MKTRWLMLGAACFVLVLTGPAEAQFAGGNGSVGNPYVITTPAHLNDVRHHLGQPGSPVYFRQDADISLQRYSNWQPIGSLTASAYVHYDGNNKRITHLNINRTSTDYVGLFGHLSGSVRWLTLESGTVRGRDYTGSVAGHLQQGEITDCLSKVTVVGNMAVGGLVGWNSGGTIIDAGYREGSVTASDMYAGGLVGYNAGRLERCFAAGEVIASTQWRGGLSGQTGGDSTVVNSYWDTQVTKQSSSYGGGTGLTTVNMMKRGSYSGWNFSSRWQLYEGKTYPYHRAMALQVATPAFSPGAGPYPGSSVSVQVTCSTPGATIHYVLGDGAAPSDTTTTTRVHGQSVPVPLPERLRAVAWVAYMNPSAIADATYSLAAAAAAPIADPAGGSHVGTSLEVTLTSSTSNAVIRYTEDGSDPTESSDLVPSDGKIVIDIPSTLKARAWHSDLNPSSIATYHYEVAGTAALPTFHPAGGSFTGDVVSVTMSSGTAGAVIRYTTDGSEPTALSPGFITQGVVTLTLTATPATLRAKVWVDGMNPSGIRTDTYQRAAQVAKPGFSPDGGSHPGDAIPVTVTNATDGAIIRYTTDGSEPDNILSPGVWSGGTINVPLDHTLKARAFKDGMNPSELHAAYFSRAGEVDAPTFDPPSGPVAAGWVTVQLNHAQADQIYFTLDPNEDPKTSGQEVVAGALVRVPVPGRIRASAVAAGLNDSVVSEAEYTTAPVTPPPSFMPGSGQDVTLQGNDPGDMIRFTLDGTEPGMHLDAVLSGYTVATVPVPGTLRARAYREGFFPSVIETAYYGDFAGGSGATNDPWQVATPEHLHQVRHHLNSHFVMVADIDLGPTQWGAAAGDAGWQPIGTSAAGFTGTFDGAGHTIANLFINRPATSYVGLFGNLSGGGSIRSIGIISGSVEGGNITGALVGQLRNAFVANSFAACNVSGKLRVGGLVGFMWGDSSSLVHVYATGAVHADDGTVGGLVGEFQAGTISKSFARGLVTAGISSNVGGLIGRNTADSGSVSLSYWDKGSSGQSGSAGGDGLTAVEMADQESFAFSDFEKVWVLRNGDLYPRLRVFDPAVPSSLPASWLTWLTRFYGSAEAAPEVSIKGVPLWQEYVAGTDPTDPSSRFIVTPVLAESVQGVMLRVPSMTGRVYRVMGAENLLGSGWDIVEGVAPQSGTGEELEFDLPMDNLRGFYRLSVELPE